MATGELHYPPYPMVHQQEGDHYAILLHANGTHDLTATEEGREVLARYKKDADLFNFGGPKPPRIPEPGELPPNHLTGTDLEDWLTRQETQALLPGEGE